MPTHSNGFDAGMTHVEGDCNWPINPPGVGMGPYTSWKLDEFAKIAGSNVGTVGNIQAGRMHRGLPAGHYYGLDLTAACGGYVWQPKGEPATHLRGTSLSLLAACLRTQRRMGLHYRVGLIEQNEKLVELLKQRLDEGASRAHLNLEFVDVLLGDHADLAVPWVLQHVRAPAWGLITMDTNGEINCEVLRALGAMRQLHMVDYALHVSAAIPKWRKRRGAASLEELLAACRKRFWFVGRTRANWQWVWFVGTDWAPWAETLKRIGLVLKDSVEGQARWDTLCLTRSQRKIRDQHSLFEEAE